MLSVSYISAAAAVGAAALYLLLRLRPFLTATTMLLGALLLVYGPAYLSFMLSAGDFVMPLKWLFGPIDEVSLVNEIFPAIKKKIPDFDAVVIAMNFSIALMYAGIIAGIEIVDRLAPSRIAALQAALANWNSQSLRDDLPDFRILLAAILMLVLFMVFVSYSEDHIGSIRGFLSTSDIDGGRMAYRLRHGGSPSYGYRVVLGTIAPMLAIWGLLTGWLHRSWWLLSLALLLLLAVGIGKIETLSKAPPALFLLQLVVSATLIFTNKFTLRTAVAAAGIVVLVLYLVVYATMISQEGLKALVFIYFRVFEVPNQALLENFAVFPFLHPHMWGANIRPLAALMGLNYIPSFTIVAETWHHVTNETSVPALFIADAWIDFSYLGVAAFSIMAGAICRSLDAIFLVHGKTVVGIAVLSAAFLGVFTLLSNSLNIASISGGLLLAPVIAGLVVAATRFFGKPMPPARNAALNE
jgi:hypothetical protein